MRALSSAELFSLAFILLPVQPFQLSSPRSCPGIYLSSQRRNGPNLSPRVKVWSSASLVDSRAVTLPPVQTPKPESKKGLTVSETVVNIFNNVAGSGILTLAYGMGLGVGWVPAMAINFGLAAISGWTFYLIGSACQSVDATTFRGLWKKTLGASTAWVVDACISLMCFFSAVIYSSLLGDLFGSLALLAFPGLGGGVADMAVRGTTILGLTATVLAPLCLIKNLSSLAFTSILGSASVMYTALFVAFRCLDGSYAVPAAGAGASALLQSLPPELYPSFAKMSMFNFDAKALVLMSSLGLAYRAHYNAPAFYSALDKPSTARFGRAVAISFGLLSILYASMMGFGYATFGDVTASNLLRNFAQGDVLAAAGRLATGLSIIFGYPLAFKGLVNGVSGLARSVTPRVAPGSRLAKVAAVVSLCEPRPPGAAPLPKSLKALAEKVRVGMTLGLLGAVTAVAVSLKDVTSVVGVSGALLGAAIVYVIPTLVYSKAKGPGNFPKALYALVPLGTSIGVLGTYMALQGA